MGIVKAQSKRHVSRPRNHKKRTRSNISWAIRRTRIQNSSKRKRVKSRAKSDVSLRFVRFLVQYRSEVQEACRDLLFLIHDSKEEHFNLGSTEWAMCGLLTGAAFSLWRAVFTAERGAAADQTGLQATEKFIENLIATNAVGFPQEQNSWSYGYYLNNARFRLAGAYKFLPAGLQTRYREEMKEISRTVGWEKRGTEDYPEYKSTHKVLLTFVKLLNEHMKSSPFAAWPSPSKRSILIDDV